MSKALPETLTALMLTLCPLRLTESVSLSATPAGALSKEMLTFA